MRTKELEIDLAQKLIEFHAIVMRSSNEEKLAAENVIKLNADYLRIITDRKTETSQAGEPIEPLRQENDLLISGIVRKWEFKPIEECSKRTF